MNENITLIEKDDIISHDKEVSETFRDFFENAVKELNMTFTHNVISDCEDIDDPILKCIKKFDIHPSIRVIKDTYVDSDLFSFDFVSIDNIIKEIRSLNSSKAIPKDTIPVVILKENINLISNVLHLIFNKSIECCSFPNKLKLADISPVFKTGDKNEKSKYRPVSILPAISKIYERLLFYQINNYFDLKLSTYQCGFRKGFSAQHCLLLMLEKCLRNGKGNG